MATLIKTEHQRAHDYQQQKNSTIAFQKGCPSGPLITSERKNGTGVVEPKTTLKTHTQRDITAWSLPYAHGIKAVATNSKIEYNAQKTSLLRSTHYSRCLRLGNHL